MKIALLNSPAEEFSSANYFKRGYIKALREFNIGINLDYIIEDKSNLSKDGGYNSTKYLISLTKDLIPTSIICNSDVTAIGVYEAIYEAKFKIPDNFSVIGNDDIEFAKYFNPPLTTISQKGYDLGKESCRLLFNEIRKE